MAIEIPIRELPLDLTLEDAVEAAYGDDLDWTAEGGFVPSAVSGR